MCGATNQRRKLVKITTMCILLSFLSARAEMKNKVKGGAGCCRCQAAMLPAAERAEPRVSYRLWLPHIDGWADGRWLALSSPLHLLHHTVHVAPGEAMEKHGCRRGEDVVAVLFSGSARQDVHQRQKKPARFYAQTTLSVRLLSVLSMTSEKSRTRKE